MESSKGFRNRETEAAMFHLCIHYTYDFAMAESNYDLSKIVMDFHDEIESKIVTAKSKLNLDSDYGIFLKSEFRKHLEKIDFDELEAQLIACKEQGLPMTTKRVFNDLYVE